MDKCTSIKNVQFLNFYLNDRACVTVSIFHLLCEPFKVNRFLTATSRRKYDEKLIKRKEKKYQGSELKGDFFFSCHHYLDVSWLAVNMKKFFFSLFLTTESNTISEMTKKKNNCSCLSSRRDLRWKQRTVCSLIKTSTNLEEEVFAEPYMQ